VVAFALFAGIAKPLRAQLVQATFPSTQRTSITDCTTPTVLDLGGGQTVTFEGGQFIQYKDGNFDGVMYASTSSAGCQQYPFGGVFNYLLPGQPYGLVRLTFSPPVAAFQVFPYNYSGETQFIVTQWWDVAGNNSGSEAFNQDSQAPLNPFFNFSYPPGGERGWPKIKQVALGALTDFFHPLPWPIDLYTQEWSLGIITLKIPQTAPDVVQFDFSNSTSGDVGKVLLSIAPSDRHYLSPFQVPGASQPQARIAGTLLDGKTKQPKSGSVYLKIIDSADPAPYRVADANAGDNEGAAAALTGGTSTSTGATKLQTDAQGRFEAVLTISSRIAGDNYQIEGAPNESFQCGTGHCPTTGMFTLWKRIYVEQENMFRSGSFLSDVAAAGSSQLSVEDPAPFQALASGAQLELVHGDRSGQPGYYADLVTFTSIRQDQNGRWIIDIDPTSVPARDYGEAPPAAGAAPNPLIAVMRDGVGVVQAGTYEANDAYVAPLLESAFVDVQTLTPVVTEVPTVTTLNRTQQLYFTQRWFQNAAGSAYSRVANPNVFHRTVAASSPLVVVTGGVGAELGVTTVAGGTNFSLIFAQTIADLTAGAIPQFRTVYTQLNPFLLNGETTAHETVHFWVHAGGADGSGHCAQSSYNGPFNCLMHTPYVGPELADGVVDMHYIAHGADSEYMFIRRAPDPVPQQ
jgi:hypothetical protein